MHKRSNRYFVLGMSFMGMVVGGFIVMLLVVRVKTTNMENRSQALVPTHYRFSLVETHPHFWPAGVAWTGKKLRGLGVNTAIPFFWVWSGPRDNSGGDHRLLIYQQYNAANQPGFIVEWEEWREYIPMLGAPPIGTAFRFGEAYDKSDPNSRYSWDFMNAYTQPNRGVSPQVYRSQTDCQQNNPRGFDWPDLESNQDFKYIPKSEVYNGSCNPQWQSHNNPGDYFALYLRHFFGDANSQDRINYCNTYVPANVTSQTTNNICRAAPNAGYVEQRYMAKRAGYGYAYGCEPLVYTWGYPRSSAQNYKNWFRNGELRYADYKRIVVENVVHDPNDHNWWGPGCQTIWDQSNGWYYTGIYRLHEDDYQDPGNNNPPQPIN